MVRQVFREMDRKLYYNKSISNIGDSLYLNFEELISPKTWKFQYKNIVNQRKLDYKNYEEMSPATAGVPYFLPHH